MKVTYAILLVAVITVVMVPNIMADAEAEADTPGQAKKIGIFDQIDKGWAWLMKQMEG
uniref:Venom peptide ECTX1-Rm61b n=1 Tax=Rhytidoponera metallica TaxID=148364 RepID=A0A8U0LTL1_RHYMT|nr:venom peptide precursor ECTX1-Rm61b [Rhytidoponera metallica]